MMRLGEAGYVDACVKIVGTTKKIAEAIADLNYQGFIAHEFVPTRSDPFLSLMEAYQLCTV